MQIFEDGITKTLLREVLREPLDHFGIGELVEISRAVSPAILTLQAYDQAPPRGRRDLSVC
jgi:hypothetical protein